jgi:tetratricopeptide (TPR) repeat protein
MCEAFDVARSYIREARQILSELDDEHALAASTHEAGMVEVLAGDHLAAAAEFRKGLSALEIMGDRVTLAGLAAHLAKVLYTQGHLQEALHWTEASEAAWGDHPYGIVDWGPTRARIQASFGHLEVAELLARAALQPFRASDDALARAHALWGLADVHIMRGGYLAAAPLLEEALALYRAKEVRPFETQLHKIVSSLAAA